MSNRSSPHRAGLFALLVMCFTCFTFVQGAAGQDAIFLKPGMRIILLGSSASIPQAAALNGPPDNFVGGGGSGLTVYDVVSVNADFVIVDCSILTIDATQNNATAIVDFKTFVGNRDGLGDVWINPKKLAEMQEVNDANQLVRRMKYPLDGKTYDAIRIQNNTPNGTIQYTYDTTTGLLLVHGSATITPGQTHAMQVSGKLLEVRQVNLPGLGSRFPDAVKRIRTVDYAGEVRSILKGSDIQMPGTPIQFHYDITSANDLFMNTRQTNNQQIRGTPPIERSFSPGTVGSIWMDPQTLARLQTGAVIDEDRTAQMRTAVSGNDGNVVAIIRQTPTSSFTSAYDLRTGMMVGAQHVRDIGTGMTIVNVRLVNQQ